MDYSEDQKNFFYSEINKRLKKDLEEKYGADFNGIGKEVPPEMEYKFLNHIVEFEEKWERAERKKIKEVLGNPCFKKVTEIAPGDLEAEIKDILVFYSVYHINVDIIEEEEVSNEDFYKFLTEELPEHEDYFLGTEGMTTNFIYEEFHPSDKLDARECVEWFLLALVNKDIEELKLHLVKEGLLRAEGQGVEKEEFVERMLNLLRGMQQVLEKKVVVNKIYFSGNNIVEADLYVRYGGKKVITEINLSFRFELLRSVYGGFEIFGYELL